MTEPIKLPWYIDLLNITLGVSDLEEARGASNRLATMFERDGTRLTENVDFEA